MLDLADARILVTGGHGFLGKHIVAALEQAGAREISTPTQEEYDLRLADACRAAVSGHDIVIHAAGTVGGIGANRERPAEFFYENAVMGLHLLEAARKAGIGKFVQIGSVCSYPKVLPTLPYRETDLWNGYPEETNAPYGLAKKMLLVQGQAYRQQYNMNVIHLLQVNLYGPGDHFGSKDSHVIPALIDRFWQAKEQKAPEVVVWGSGNVSREFLYAPDAAHGIVLATQYYNKIDPVNLGSGQEITIKELATLIAQRVGYRGTISWDTSRPDGQPRRLFDSSRAQREFNFSASTSFMEGLDETIEWYAQHVAKREVATV